MNTTAFEPGDFMSREPWVFHADGIDESFRIGVRFWQMKRECSGAYSSNVLKAQHYRYPEFLAYLGTDGQNRSSDGRTHPWTVAVLGLIDTWQRITREMRRGEQSSSSGDCIVCVWSDLRSRPVCRSKQTTVRPVVCMPSLAWRTCNPAYLKCS